MPWGEPCSFACRVSCQHRNSCCVTYRDNLPPATQQPDATRHHQYQHHRHRHHRSLLISLSVSPSSSLWPPSVPSSVTQTVRGVRIAALGCVATRHAHHPSQYCSIITSITITITCHTVTIITSTVSIIISPQSPCTPAHYVQWLTSQILSCRQTRAALHPLCIRS